MRSLGAVSHAIRLSELSTVSTNVAIPTIWKRGATPNRGNCMRHSRITRATGIMRSRSSALPLALPLVAQPVTRQWPGTADSARAHNLPKPHRDGPRGHTQTPDDTSTHTRCSVSPTHLPTHQAHRGIVAPMKKHLQHRLFLANKPKSHNTTTTFWPVTRASYHPETPRHDKEGARPASGPSDG